MALVFVETLHTQKIHSQESVCAAPVAEKPYHNKKVWRGMQQHLRCPSLLEELEDSLGAQPGVPWEAACSQPQLLMLWLDLEKPPVLSTHTGTWLSWLLFQQELGSAWHRHLCLGGHQHTGAAALRPGGEISLLCLCQISAHNPVFNMSAGLLDFIS